jgi:hypothetical protein
MLCEFKDNSFLMAAIKFSLSEIVCAYKKRLLFLFILYLFEKPVLFCCFRSVVVFLLRFMYIQSVFYGFLICCAFKRNLHICFSTSRLCAQQAHPERARWRGRPRREDNRRFKVPGAQVYSTPETRPVPVTFLPVLNILSDNAKLIHRKPICLILDVDFASLSQ